MKSPTELRTEGNLSTLNNSPEYNVFGYLNCFSLDATTSFVQPSLVCGMTYHYHTMAALNHLSWVHFLAIPSVF